MGRSSDSRMSAARIGLAMLIAVAGLLAMRGALSGAFIFDDYTLLALPRFLDNPFMPFWHQHVEGGLHYRPVGILLWWISERLFGAHPLPHYLINAGLLAAICIVLWRFLVRVFEREGLAFSIAIIFVVHPIAVATTIWLSNRYELIGALLGLSGLTLAWRFRVAPRTATLAGSLIFFACALCAKEDVLALISAAFVLWWWPSDEQPAWFSRRQLPCLWLVALVATWLLVRGLVLPETGTEALFAYKSAWQLFRDGMTAWFLKLPDYLAFVPRIGLIEGWMLFLGALGTCWLVLVSARMSWSRDRLAVLLGGLAIIAVADIVQWPRTGLVLMNLRFGADTLEDVLGARHYFMAGLGFAIALAALLASPDRERAHRKHRFATVLIVLLLLVPHFSVSQHLARSYRGSTLQQDTFTQAAIDAIEKLPLPAEKCQIYLLDTHSKLFGFFSDMAVKALIPDLERVSGCFVQTENAPWYYLVDRALLQRQAEQPFTRVRVGDGFMQPIVLDAGALVYLNLNPGSQPPLGKGSFFLSWTDGKFADIGEQVRAGTHPVTFECFRAPTECP